MQTLRRSRHDVPALENKAINELRPTVRCTRPAVATVLWKSVWMGPVYLGMIGGQPSIRDSGSDPPRMTEFFRGFVVTSGIGQNAFDM